MRHARRRPFPDLGEGRQTPVRGLEGRARDRARGVRRPRFNRADVAGGALAPRRGARSAADRRHRRSWLASRGRARGARRQAPGASLDLPHRTLRWTGAKPKTGLPAAARAARYRLLAQAARNSGATHILTAHTRDDQAETLLMRLLRGSGIAGLAAMARESERDGVLLARPFLNVSKSQLIATLKKAKVELCRRSDQPRPEFHAPATARGDAGARRRGRRCAQPGAAGVAACPGQCRGGSAGRRRRALSRAEGSRTNRVSMPRRLPRCRRKSDCGFCFARSIGSVMRDRRSLARSKPCWRRWTGPAPKTPGGSRPRLKQTLAGALVSLIDGRIRIEPAPRRRRRTD